MAVDIKSNPEKQDFSQAGDSSNSWFQIASYPDRTLGNPHLELLYGALADDGVQHLAGLEITTRWLETQASNVDAIHIHWPERIWRGKLRGRIDRLLRTVSLRQIRGVLRLKRFLSQASALGIKRIWTVHNVEHHEGSTWIDRWGYRTLARECDLLITYAQCSADQVAEEFDCHNKVLVMKHGNYSGCYQTPRPRDEVLSELGLSMDKPTLCCVGIIRNQKGLSIACQAAKQLGDDYQLIIAGECHPSFDAESLADETKNLPNAIWVRKQLDDQEFSDVVGACDAVLLPYIQVTGSGVLHAAWSLGRGVIASDLPYFREAIAHQPDAGKLFPVGNSNAMATAICQYLDIPVDRRTNAARMMAEEHNWDRCVEPMIGRFRQWKYEAERASKVVVVPAG